MPDAGSVRSALTLFETGKPLLSTQRDRIHIATTELVRNVFDVEDTWIKACVLTELGEYLDDRRIRACLSDPSQLIRDAAIRLDKGEGTMQTDTTVSMVERAIFLRQTPVLSRLTPALLEIVATACEEQSFRKGDVIDEEGAVADRMYIIVEGSVRILTGAERVEVARRGPGDVIGEMSMISRQPRSATMVAAELSTTLVLSHRAFEQILRRSPDVSLAVMKVLCERLVEAETR